MLRSQKVPADGTRYDLDIYLVGIQYWYGLYCNEQTPTSFIQCIPTYFNSLIFVSYNLLYYVKARTVIEGLLLVY
jgi:hypothetical protein